MNSKAEKIREVDDRDESDHGETMTHRATTFAHKAIDGAAEKAEPVEHRLREQVSKAGEKLDETQAAATEEVKESLKKAETFVRERPVAATGIAFAAGVLTAIILRR